MTLNTFPAALVDMASGVPLILLGLWLTTLRPRRGATSAFAVFSTAFGVAQIVSNLYSFDDPLISSAFVLTGLGLLVAGLALYPVLRAFPRPLGPRDRLRLALGISTLLSAVSLLPWLQDPAVAGPSFPGAPGLSLLVVAWLSLPFVVVSGAFILLLAMRAARADEDLAPMRQDALMAAALALLLGYNVGYWLLAPDLGTFSGALATAVIFALAAGLWLRGAARRRDAGARVGRNVALVYLAVPALAMAITMAWGGYANAGYGPFGVARMVAVLLLAYGILRHQLFGLDVKVKWTIRRGTVAGVFLAVFFVVAQVAQNALSQQYGLLLGGISAGLLLFAIAPIQRAAERVANAAVPGVREGPAHPSRKADAYLAALRLARAEGPLTRDKERHLAVLQEHLGISPTEALALREQVEQEGRRGSLRRGTMPPRRLPKGEGR